MKRICIRIKITVILTNIIFNVIGQDFNTAYQKAYEFYENNTEAIKYAKEANGYAKESGRVIELATSHFLLAYYQDQAKNYADALSNYYGSLKYYRKLRDEKYVSDILMNIGVIYKENFSYENALYFYEEAAVVKERLGEDFLLAGIFRNMAKVYRLKERYDSALIFNHKALELYNKLDHKDRISIVFNEIGLDLYHLGEYEQARDYFFNAIVVVENTEMAAERKAKTYNNTGLTYKQEKDFTKAKGYLRNSLDIIAGLPDFSIELTMETYNELAGIYLLENNLDSARILYEHSISLTNLDDYLNEQLTIALEKIIELTGKDNGSREIIYLRPLKDVYHTIAKEKQKYEQLYAFQRIQSVMYKIQKEERDIMLKDQRRVNFIIYSLTGLGIFLIIFLGYRYVRKIKLFKKNALEELKDLI